MDIGNDYQLSLFETSHKFVNDISVGLWIDCTMKIACCQVARQVIHFRGIHFNKQRATSEISN